MTGCLCHRQPVFYKPNQTGVNHMAVVTNMYDSFTKAMDQFNAIHGDGWQRHIHPQDRDEMCGYMIRMVSDNKDSFNVWNATTNRPNGIEKLTDCVKTLLRCTSERSYFVEAKPRY